MNPKERSAEVWDSLVVLASQGNSNDRQVSRVLGRAPDFVGYAKRQRKKGASFEEVIGLVEATGEPECVVFGRLFPQPAPAELLRLLRKIPKVERMAKGTPPLLAHVEKIFSGLSCTLARPEGILAERPRPSPRRRLVWIDELRLTEPDNAHWLVVEEITSLVIVLSCAQHPEPSLVGDLAFAVCLWGDLLRLNNQWNLALICVPLALDLAERSGDRWANAHCLWMAALLAHDLGYPDHGLPWLDRASFLFGLDHQLGHLPELLASQGTLLVASGRREQGIAALREALARLPAQDRRWRQLALLQVAAYEQEASRPGEALSHLEILAKEYLQQDALQAQIQWRRAAALLSLEKMNEGIAAFGKAVFILSKLGRPKEAASRMCDFAEWLIRHGKSERVNALAGEIQVAWGRFTQEARLAELAEDFYALSRMRPLQQPDVDRTRNLLEELGPRSALALPVLGPSA